jgi:hypothetical protein
MADENKTIAIFDGDASGARKAASEAAAAVKSHAAELEGLAAAEQKAGAAAEEHARKLDVQNQVRARAGKNVSIDLGGGGNQQAPQAAIRAQEELGDITEEVSAQIRTEADILYGLGDAGEEAGNKTAEGAKAGAMGMSNLAQAMSVVSPEAGRAVGAAKALGESIGFLATPAGVAMAAIGLLAAGASYLMDQAAKKAEEIREKYKDLQAQAENLERRRLESGKSVASELAGMGAGSGEQREEAVKTADRLKELGFDASAATKVAAATAATGTKLSDDELLRLALGVQQGKSELKGSTPEEIRDSLSRAVDTMNAVPKDQRKAQEEGVSAVTGAQADYFESLTKGRKGMIREWLEREKGYSGKELDARTRGLTEYGGGGIQRDDEGNLITITDEDRKLYDELLQQRNRAAQARNNARNFSQSIINEEYDGRAQPSTHVRTSDAPSYMTEEEASAWEKKNRPPQAPEVDPEEKRKQEEETKRRERVQNLLRAVESNYQKATLSPEELLKAQLTEAGATPDEIARALDWQQKTSAAVAASKPPPKSSQSQTPRAQAQPAQRFDPDTQNQPVTVNNTFSGHVVIGNTADPRLGRLPRSPVR